MACGLGKTGHRRGELGIGLSRRLTKRLGRALNSLVDWGRSHHELAASFDA